MITLDQSFNKNNQSNQTGQDFQMFFSLGITEWKRPLFKETGREGREREGEGERERERENENLGHLSPRLS